MIAAQQIAFGKAAGGGPTAYWWLCFTAEQDGSTVAMAAVGSAPAVTLETSRDGEIWEPFYVGETSITLNKGECVYFRAGEGGNTAFGITTSDYNKFSLTTGKITASGDIMSLLNGEETSDTIPVDSCFAHTFAECTSLVSAPELPATTLKEECYQGMFYGCTSLVSAPELHATTLKPFCYYGMFYGCTSLVSAPKLHATTLASPACCVLMFYMCTKLNEITVAFSSWSPAAVTASWVSGVSSTGTFYCPTALGTDETITRGMGACPKGWTVINTD